MPKMENSKTDPLLPHRKPQPHDDQFDNPINGVKDKVQNHKGDGCH
jgi:hypothetical protein